MDYTFLPSHVRFTVIAWLYDYIWKAILPSKRHTNSSRTIKATHNLFKNHQSDTQPLQGLSSEWKKYNVYIVVAYYLGDHYNEYYLYLWKFCNIDMCMKQYEHETICAWNNMSMKPYEHGTAPESTKWYMNKQYLEYWI